MRRLKRYFVLTPGSVYAGNFYGHTEAEARQILDGVRPAPPVSCGEEAEHAALCGHPASVPTVEPAAVAPRLHRPRKAQQKDGHPASATD